MDHSYTLHPHFVGFFPELSWSLELPSPWGYHLVLGPIQTTHVLPHWAQLVRSLSTGYLTMSLTFQVESICLCSSKQPTFLTTSGDYWEFDNSLAVLLFVTYYWHHQRRYQRLWSRPKLCMAIPTAGRQFIEYVLSNRDKFKEPLVQHIMPLPTFWFLLGWPLRLRIALWQMLGY